MQTNPSLKRIQEVAFQLQDDLLQLDIDALDVSESVKSYFRYDLTKLSYVSKCNAFILYHLLLNQNSKKSNAIIVDHGAGIGLFSFLVKRMGYTCISHDLFDEYLDGIRKIGTALNARPDYFVLGDTNALIAYCHFHDLSILGLASRNVIEHLPDYREFFNDIAGLGSEGFSVVITTSANIHNPLVKRLHLKIHKEYEYKGSRVDMDHPDLDESLSGVQLRSELIRNHFPQLDSETIRRLAILNRSYIEKDILKRTQHFIQSGNWPVPPIESSNTCDPITGAWVERLVAYSDYQNAAESAGFSIEALPGFYNTNYASFLKNCISIVLNGLLKFKHPFVLNLSPFLAMKLTKK